MNNSNRIQQRAFARNDGAWLGILWIASFACAVWGMKVPLIGTLGTALAVLTPFFIFRRIQAFRDYVRQGLISYWNSYSYSLSMFFYGSILLAVAQYVFFAFIDHGSFIAGTLNQVKDLLIAGNYLESEVSEAMAYYEKMRPIDWSIYFMSVNIMIGVLVSIAIALFAYRSKRIEE